MSKPIFNPVNRQRPNSVEAKFLHAATVEHAATLTKKAMASTFASLAKCAKLNTWGKTTPETLTEKQWSKFVATGLAAGNSSRTMQNQQVHVRRALSAVGRSDFANSITNKDLGIPSATRIGSGKATDPEVLRQALERADATAKAWIQLSASLGLRQREMVRSGPSLKQWERQLSSGQPVSLHDGAKGGRSRQICVRPEARQEALEAVRAVMAVAEGQGGRVVASERLESACSYVSQRLSEYGLAGENSHHSLRRQFAIDQLNYYRSEGYAERDARALVSNDLGHGDSRGTWVWNNYVRATEQAAA
jgi:hypothetical protein